MPDAGAEDHATVHVRFYDHATGEAFAESHVPAGQLPDSFEARTTLHLGDADWDVVEARPVTAVEFRRSGQLTLVLSRVETRTVDPRDILFSLPTIAGDALPAVAAGSSKLGADVLEIHEDDWRQVEWLSASAAEAIGAELAAVRAIYENERQGYGFRRCHVRTAVPTPLAGPPLTLDELRSALGPRATWLAGFGYRGVAGIVAGSFAVRLLSSVELFGVVAGGVVQSVCFANTRANNVPRPDVGTLARFAAARDLVLVDWCRVAAVPPTDEDYAAYFAPAD